MEGLGQVADPVGELTQLLVIGLLGPLGADPVVLQLFRLQPVLIGGVNGVPQRDPVDLADLALVLEQVVVELVDLLVVGALILLVKRVHVVIELFVLLLHGAGENGVELVPVPAALGVERLGHLVDPLGELTQVLEQLLLALTALQTGEDGLDDLANSRFHLAVAGLSGGVEL